MSTVHARLRTIASGGEYGSYEVSISIDDVHEGGIRFAAKSRKAAARYALDVGNEVAVSHGLSANAVMLHTDFPKQPPLRLPLGTKLVNKAHPEYGVFVVDVEYGYDAFSKGNLWGIRSLKGGSPGRIEERELNDWKRVR